LFERLTHEAGERALFVEECTRRVKRGVTAATTAEQTREDFAVGAAFPSKSHKFATGLHAVIKLRSTSSGKVKTEKGERTNGLVSHRGWHREARSLASNASTRCTYVVMAGQVVRLTYFIGTMIEVPGGALTADEIAQTAEFFSFGTNDLTLAGVEGWWLRVEGRDEHGGEQAEPAPNS